ncbi:hypothetical protein RI054_12g61330 [Pseudoscourfieldia marina]
MLAKIVFVLLSVLVMVAVGALADGHDKEMASALAGEDHDDHDHGHESHDDEAKKGCANNELCKKAFQTVLMSHDICEEEQLPLSLEVGLHVFEDKCEDVLCNSASEPFDPMAVECGTGNDAYEWAGTFNFSGDASHTWSMQAVGGKYADPAMRLVFIPTTDTTEGAIKTHEAKAVGMMTGNSCAVTKPGSTSKIEQGGSCFEMTVGSADDSEFTLDTTGISGVVIYAQHVPTEFERNRHYLYDSKSTDIEPVAQIPSGGGGGHDHGHDHDHGHGSEPCGCISKEFGFALDCNKTEVIQAAVNYLQDENCKNNKTPECIRNFYIFQAHHDFCAHDDLPPFNEIVFHAMEEHFDTCFIERQYNPKLSMCPPVNCEDKEALKKAVDEMYEHCEAPATPKDNGE